MTNIIYAIAFVLSVGNASQEKNADLLIESIRAFGGRYSNAPIYVVVMDSIETPCKTLRSRGNVFIRTHKYSKNISYYFADKVYASAQVEEEVERSVKNLVWLDSEVLVFQEPSKLLLKESYKIGIRPVFLHNGIALDAHTKPNAYWNGIYLLTGLNTESVPEVETVLDEKKVYAYYNCQVVTVDPAVGIFRDWAKRFDELLADSVYMKSSIPSGWHHYFLHQAVLSAVITSKVKEKEIFTLPLSYNYSLNKHLECPKSKRIKRINDLTIAIHELTLTNHPDWVHLYGVENPLKDWLNKRIPNLYKVNERIYREESNCNAYLIKTSDGYVLVDPGGTADSTSWLAYNFMKERIKAIILTHSHSDHLAGILKWDSNYDIPIFISKNAKGYVKDEEMLAEFYQRRASIQGNVLPRPKLDWSKVSYFEDYDTLRIDDLELVLYASPAETPDAAVIAIPKLKTIICGDSYNTSFPNIGLLRGSVPRLARGYANAMDIVLRSNSEYLLPGHGEPVIGKDNVYRKAKNYRDAILYVFDKTIEGMNAGKSQITLMNEITLPDSFGVNEFYGRSSWTVRGIYDYYNGWFNGSTEGMYPAQPEELNALLVKIAGSSKSIIDEAYRQFDIGNYKLVMELTSIVLSSEPNSKDAIKLRIESIDELLILSNNYIERQWLKHEKKVLRDRL